METMCILKLRLRRFHHRVLLRSPEWLCLKQRNPNLDLEAFTKNIDRAGIREEQKLVKER
jgi:hypothetical protein